MEPPSSTPRKKKRDQNLVHSIEADLNRLHEEVLRTREELEYEKIVRRTAEEQLSLATQEKISDTQKTLELQTLQTKLQQAHSQLNDANMTITKLSAEKADLMIQLELTSSDLTTAEENLTKMQREHATDLQDRSELLEEINQLVDAMNSEKLKYEYELEELSKIDKENSQKLEEKDQIVLDSQREVEERNVEIMSLTSECEDFKKQLEVSNRLVDTLRLTIKGLENTEVEQNSLRDSVSHLRKLNLELVDTNSRLLEDKNRVFDQSKESEQHETILQRMREEQLAAERQIHLLQEQLHSKEMGEEDFEAKRLDSMQREVEQLANTLEELMTANNNQQSVICSLHDSVRKKDSQISNLKSFKQECELTMNKLRSEASAMQSQLIEFESNDARLETQSEVILLNKLRSEDKDKMKSLLSQNRIIESEKQDVMRGYTQLAEENNKRTIQLSKMKQRAKQQETENKTLREKLQQSEAISQTKSNDITNLKETLKVQKSRQRANILDRSSQSAPSVAGKRPSSSHSADSTGHRELHQELTNLRASYQKMQTVCKQLEQQLADERRQKQDNEISSTRLHLMDLNSAERRKSAKSFGKELGLARAEQSMVDIHDWYQDRIGSLEHDLAVARYSAEELEKANKCYERDLEDESQLRMNQDQEARRIIQESRETIHELRDRTSQAEDDQTHSQRVISQLSQRLIKSIQDYKYLQEISMTRCQELVLEAKPKI